MTDDRRKQFPRSRSHWDDDDRATIGKGTRQATRQTSVQGHPIVAIDHELTPPPLAPTPLADRVNDYDSIAPPVREVVEALRDDIGVVVTALGRVWDGRADSSRIARLEAKIDGYANETSQHSAQLDTFVMPAVKALTAKLDVVLQYTERSRIESERFSDRDWPAVTKTLEAIQKTLDGLDNRLDRLERTLDKIVDQVGAHGSRIGAVEQICNAYDVRITNLERLNADRRLVTESEQKATARIFNRARMVLVAVIAVVSFLAANGPAIVAWLRK